MQRWELKEITVFLEETTAPAGVMLITEGLPNYNFFMLISGVLEGTQGGRHKVFLHPVETFGEIGMGTGEATETIVTVTPVRLLVADQARNRALGYLMASRAHRQVARVSTRTMLPNPA
jgi:CRP-like cAMP-binding protein